MSSNDGSEAVFDDEARRPGLGDVEDEFDGGLCREECGERNLGADRWAKIEMRMLPDAVLFRPCEVGVGMLHGGCRAMVVMMVLGGCRRVRQEGRGLPVRQAVTDLRQEDEGCDATRSAGQNRCRMRSLPTAPLAKKGSSFDVAVWYETG